MSRARVTDSEESTVSQSGRLPNFPELKAWASRYPQAVVKCSITDCVTMPHVEWATDMGRASRADLFMLSSCPCYYVELVGWVAGIDSKTEKGEVDVELDDGNGDYLVMIRLRLAERTLQTKENVKAPTPDLAATLDYFPDSKKGGGKAKPKDYSVPPSLIIKQFQWPNIQVGDTIRFVGFIEQFTMKGGETKRYVYCDLKGGTGAYWHSDLRGQMQHAKHVAKLHREVYSLPFDISARDGVPAIATQANDTVNSALDPNSTFNTTSSSIGTSDMLDSQVSEAKLRAPEKLHRRLLTDATYLRYLSDYMTTAVLSALQEAGPSNHQLIHRWIPEYAKAAMPTHARMPSATAVTAPPFTIPHLLNVPQLKTLAGLVVTADSDRRVKRKIQDDLELSAKTKAGSALRKALRETSQLAPEDVEKRSRRLLLWALRSMAEDGSIVQVKAHHGGEAYLPLPHELVSHVMLHLLEKERTYRRGFFMKPTDPRKSNGVSVVDLLRKLRSWGDEGRWERVPEWLVEDGIDDLNREERVRKWGSGWWPVD